MNFECTSKLSDYSLWSKITTDVIVNILQDSHKTYNFA